MSVDQVTNQPQPALAVEGLSFTYPGSAAPALADINLTLHPGELAALVGPNGAGKSTLLNLIACALPLQQGQVRIFGQPGDQQRNRVAYVPQRGDINWRVPLSVREVIMMGRYPYLQRLKGPGPADQAAVDAALEQLNLADLAARRVSDLSGGQKQRVILARALAQEARILLLDEPLNGLDMPTQEVIFHLLEDITHLGLMVLVSIHDLGLLRSHFGRVIFVDKRIIADGPTAEVLTVQTLEKAYGVELHLNGERR